MQRYFEEPYRFVSPYPGTFWCHLLRPVAPRHLSRKMRIPLWHFEGTEHLRDSLSRGAGILLASNHCRWADPLVLGMLSLEVKRYFYYVASHHLFRQNRLLGWLMRRLGGFSILREGTDREALRACSRILANAERPLVLFPEGTWFRQNDRLGPLQEGLSLIARQAARQSDKPIVVHPVALKYWLLEDPRPALAPRLGDLERELGWKEQDRLDLVARVEKLGGALLTLKEIEHFGSPQAGGIDDRITRLVVDHITRIETEHLGRVHTGHTLERIRRLRQKLVRQLADPSPDVVARAQHDLGILMFCENLASHSLEYLHRGMELEFGFLERLTETVQRIEESLTDAFEVPPVPMGACVRIGPALDVRGLAAGRRDPEAGDPLLVALARDIQGLLDQHLASGPPTGWNCPRVPGPRSAAPNPDSDLVCV